MRRLGRHLEPAEQRTLENCEFLLRSVCREKLLAQFRGSLTAPEIGKRCAGILQFGGGQAQERKRTAWPENDAGGRSLLVGVDDGKCGVCTGHNATVARCKFAGIVAIVDARAIFPEINDQRNLARRKYALERVRHDVVVAEPHEADEVRERR